MNYLHMALAATLGTWAMTALGAAVVLPVRRPSPRLTGPLLAFAAGVMTAASFFSLLLPAIDMARAADGLPAWMVAVLGLLLGAGLIWLADQLLARAPGGGDARRLRLLLLSITLHNIPEGLAVGVAFGALAGGPPASMAGAVSLALGIGLQNLPEGAAVALPLRQSGLSRHRSFFLGQLSGLVEPLAGVLGALMVARMTAVLPYALAFAAGAMLWVAADELIPESRRVTPPHLAAAAFMLGFAAMMALDVGLG